MTLQNQNRRCLVRAALSRFHLLDPYPGDRRSKLNAFEFQRMVFDGIQPPFSKII